MEVGMPRTHAGRGSWSRGGAIVLGAAMAVLAGVVAISMVSGLDRTFERGTASVAAMLVQEAIGALALVALGATALRLRRFADGNGKPSTIGLFVLALAICVAWALSYVLEYSG